MTCENSFEANMVKGRLESAELQCFLTNENISSLLPQYHRMLGAGVQVMIKAEDYNKAVEVLDLAIPAEAVCPGCNSTNLKLSLGKNKGKKVITMLLSLFSGVPFNNINNVYHCLDCHTEFTI